MFTLPAQSEEISRSIQESSSLLALVTPSFVETGWCDLALDLAFTFMGLHLHIACPHACLHPYAHAYPFPYRYAYAYI